MSKESIKVALITGGGSGVGRACAVRFASLGFDVVVNYQRNVEGAQKTQTLVEAVGRQAMLAQCDVSQDAEVVEMIRGVEAHFGRIDVLVNSAGTTYFVKHTDLDGMSEEKWDRILAVNTKGSFFVIRAAMPLLKKAEGAAVVNISSASALSGVGSSIAYSASKGALNTMTKALARAYAPKVRINAVCPGPIDSRLAEAGIVRGARLLERKDI